MRCCVVVVPKRCRHDVACNVLRGSLQAELELSDEVERQNADGSHAVA